jgi:hypothetical protein
MHFFYYHNDLSIRKLKCKNIHINVNIKRPISKNIFTLTLFNKNKHAILNFKFDDNKTITYHHKYELPQLIQIINITKMV